jgi:hypothetical protein
MSLDRDEWRSNKSMIIDESNTIKMPAITKFELETLKWKKQEDVVVWWLFACAVVGILAAIFIWGG